jgi:hypothetical protein
MRIFSSEVYFLRDAARTCRMKVLVSWVRVSALWPWPVLLWDTLAPFLMWILYTQHQELFLPSSSPVLSPLIVSHYR